jgi:hypothetical protein
VVVVVDGIWTVVVFQTAGVRQPAFGDTSQNRGPHIYWLLSASASLPETG